MIDARSRAHDSAMRSPEDIRYFEMRAEQELACAEQAHHPDAARAHALLAAYYLDLVHACSKPASSRAYDRPPAGRTPKGARSTYESRDNPGAPDDEAQSRPE